MNPSAKTFCDVWASSEAELLQYPAKRLKSKQWPGLYVIPEIKQCGWELSAVSTPTTRGSLWSFWWVCTIPEMGSSWVFVSSCQWWIHTICFMNVGSIKNSSKYKHLRTYQLIFSVWQDNGELPVSVIRMPNTNWTPHLMFIFLWILWWNYFRKSYSNNIWLL